MSLISVIMNLQNQAVTQYSNFEFNSFCKIGDTLVAASDAGIFSLEGDTDNGADIDASFDLLTTDFGVANLKRLRFVYLGGRTGNIILSVKDDEGNERQYTIAQFKVDKQTGVKAPIGRDGLGRYWTIAISNVDGSDFSIDTIEVVPVILGRKPRQR